MSIVKQLCLVSLFTLSVSLLQAQDYAFKVIVNKGKNEFKSGNSWQPLRVGTSLLKTDELRLAENSYLGLVHYSGKPLELKHSGKYKVADLKVAEGSGVVNKYTDFILSSASNPKNTLKATGAVHRGLNNINVYLPDSIQPVVYNSKVIINWSDQGITGPYTIMFASLFGDELKLAKVEENHLLIDLENPEFQNEDNILVTVSTNDGSKVSKEYVLKKLSKADKARVENSLKEISSQLSEETALNKFIQAGFYEQNSLLIDAATAYQEAIKLEPNVQAYQDVYLHFLYRNGLKE